MDFGSLLQTAKENGQNKRDVRYYSTKFTPPKKEEKKAKNLSVNIQKFLARKEAEEKKKTLEANRKRDELLALRSKDKKATRRVNVMLKRTKSANQSVIEDAVDKDNTAVTLAGPSQPDEDDYGYVSQEAAAFYNKMMEKYNKMPDDPKFNLSKKKASNNLISTKDRVRAALEREKEEALLPHRRKRKNKEESETPTETPTECSEKNDEIENSVVKKKPKFNPPPALNFNDLLKLAAVKQHEPIVIEVKPKEEEGPLLTKKQKKELELERQRKEAKNQRILQQSNSKISPKPAPSIPPSAPSQTAKKNPPRDTPQTISKQNGKVQSLNQAVPTAKTVTPKSQIPPKMPPRPVPKNDIPRKSVESNNRQSITKQPAPKSAQPPKPINKSVDVSRKNSISNNNNNKERLSGVKSKMPENGPVKKPLPPPSQQVKPKQFPPPDVRRRDPPPKPKPVKRPIIYDDEDYDSEMDDFIDDGPEEMQDYSKYIKDIFGYDKSKYRGMDEDINDMESTFAQQMREDVRSTKLGIMEDLEDIKREREEKKRKQMMKKRKL